MIALKTLSNILNAQYVDKNDSPLLQKLCENVGKLDCLNAKPSANSTYKHMITATRSFNDFWNIHEFDKETDLCMHWGNGMVTCLMVSKLCALVLMRKETFCWAIMLPMFARYQKRKLKQNKKSWYRFLADPYGLIWILWCVVPVLLIFTEKTGHGNKW